MGVSLDFIAGGELVVPASNVAALDADLRCLDSVALLVDASCRLMNLFDALGLSAVDNDDGSVTVASWRAGATHTEEYAPLLDILARHADPDRVDWVLRSDTGDLWAERFENGERHELDVEIRLIDDAEDPPPSPPTWVYIVRRCADPACDEIDVYEDPDVAREAADITGQPATVVRKEPVLDRASLDVLRREVAEYGTTHGS